jgi:hypothetical protein
MYAPVYNYKKREAKTGLKYLGLLLRKTMDFIEIIVRNTQIHCAEDKHYF